MRGVSKSLLALAVMALLALSFSACGGSDDSGTTAATTAQESTATTSPSQEGSGEDQGSADNGEDDGGSEGSDDSGSGDSSSGADEGSASFRVPGGDNSIQNFGEEPDESQLEEAEAVLADFLEARAKGDWSGMCANLAESAVAPLEDLASRSPQFKGAGCAAILKALLAKSPGPSRVNTMSTGLASLRVEGERAFALYHGSDGNDYFMLMVDEDGDWKAGALAPSEFP